MDRYVIGLDQIDAGTVAPVGAKAAALAALTRLDGIMVPPGFVVTADAFTRALAAAASIDAITVPAPVAREVTRALAALGAGPVAVRSTATVEDLPGASSAGQYDSYLDVSGADAVLDHVRRCWISLMTPRAVAYRGGAGIDERQAQMAVLVQRMVPARASGVLFTADPVSSDRTLCVAEATRGLGEQLVAGRVDPDRFTVRDGTICTAESASAQPVLSEAQVRELAALGRRIEAHFGGPQDIEWCLADAGFQIVQSRAITTLFPIPAAAGDGPHVYISVGHQQMMTDAMTPLGLSVWQLTTPRPMAEAGGRLFVDVAAQLALPSIRDALLEGFSRSDPLIGDALRTVVERGEIVAAEPPADGSGVPARPAWLGPQVPIAADPALVDELIERGRAALATLEREIATRSGVELIDFILGDFARLREALFDPRAMEVISSASQAGQWLDEQIAASLGIADVADALSQSAPHNVTAEMGLALLDVADVVRPHPEVVALLERAPDPGFLDELPALPGGAEVRDAIRGYLDSYGMRCAGEIDIARPRWSERPETLLPMLLSNVRNFAAGEGPRRLAQGLARARDTEHEVITGLEALPDGAEKLALARAAIARLRTFTGYREYPKFGMVSRYLVYKRALLAQARRLVEADVLAEPEEIFMLRLPELREVVAGGHADHELIARRRDQLRADAAGVAPRVSTGDGEVIAGDYRRSDAPTGALLGLSVSAGLIEGRARVVLDLAQADLAPGDILVTRYTDPSWTPLFVAVAGLVTEVGGLMTHGAVIAREYGLPAVVGVQDATRLIADGARIRLDATGGYVELL